jgi:hypothetical protein
MVPVRNKLYHTSFLALPHEVLEHILKSLIVNVRRNSTDTYNYQPDGEIELNTAWRHGMLVCTRIRQVALCAQQL